MINDILNAIMEKSWKHTEVIIKKNPQVSEKAVKTFKYINFTVIPFIIQIVFFIVTLKIFTAISANYGFEKAILIAIVILILK